MKVVKTNTINGAREDTYSVDADGTQLVYKEWVNEKGKVIDCELRDIDGYDIDDADLLEDIQKEIDKTYPN